MHAVSKGAAAERYDTFIIWGNGLDRAEEIIREIRASPAFEIVRVQRYRPKSIRRFVRDVYANDFVPLQHLRSKTRYLLKTAPEVIVVIARNTEPREDLVGEGEFRQTQCLTVKELKERIRDRFNPVRDGVRTEEHVVHGTDVEFQTDHILKLLGVRRGIAALREPTHPLLEVPYHLTPFRDFEIVYVPFRSLYCSVLTGSGSSVRQRVVHLTDSPHYRGLNGDPDAYRDYVERYATTHLLDLHRPEVFDALADGFSYLAAPHEMSFVIAERQRPDRYVVADGAHRAAIVCSQGDEGLLVAVPLRAANA